VPAISRTRPIICALLLAAFSLVALACDRSQADQWVDVGGYKLGVHCEGSGLPTVLLDAGGGSNSGTWRQVQPGVAKFTRVCSYDRAGLANSEDRLNRDIDGTYLGEELHTLLADLGEKPPFVFVGQSVGAIYVRTEVARYPDDAAGFIFVDPTTEDQFAAFDAEYQIPHFGDEGGSHIDYGPVIEALHAAPDYGDKPIITFDSGKIDNPIWLELRRAVSQKSTNSMLVVANSSGHTIHKQQPGLVVRGIELVVDAVRSKSQLPECSSSFTGMDATCEPVR
jgi:hypothetical protein